MKQQTTSKQAKLTKAQQALYERIQVGEQITRSFSGKYHGEDRKTIPYSVIDGLKVAGKLSVEKQEIAGRLYFVLKIIS